MKLNNWLFYFSIADDRYPTWALIIKPLKIALIHQVRYGLSFGKRHFFFGKEVK